MEWLKKSYLRFKLKIWSVMKKFSCIDLVKKAFPDGVSESEKATAETLCRYGFLYLEIIKIITTDREFNKLISLLKEKFPDLSDEEIEKLIDQVRSVIKEGKSAKYSLEKIKTSDEKSLKNKI